MLKQRSRAVALTALVSLSLSAPLASAGTASAESSSCSFARYPEYKDRCETETVKANPTGHFVFFEVSPNAHYKLKDETTGVVVRSGTAGILGKRQTVFGMYGLEYRLYVGNPIAVWGYISNQ